MSEDEPDDEFDADDSLPLRELRRLAGGRCVECGEPFTAREALGAVALGFKAAPRCHSCLSRRLDRDPGELRGELVAYVHRRECFLKAWREAERMDGAGPISCSGRAGAGGVSPLLNSEETGGLRPPLAKPELTVWNAGDLGCGELVMELRLRLAALPPGAEIEVVATDPAAPEDIPSWCRMTGHPLVTATHPRYRIRRKET